MLVYIYQSNTLDYLRTYDGMTWINRGGGLDSAFYWIGVKDGGDIHKANAASFKQSFIITAFLIPFMQGLIFALGKVFIMNLNRPRNLQIFQI